MLVAILIMQGVFAGFEIIGRTRVSDPAFQTVISAAFVVYVVLLAVFAFGAWRRMSWAWMVAIAVTVFGLALSGLRILAGEQIEQLLLGIAIDGALLYYLAKPSVRALFRA
jgi:uncharacterized membrane protein (DUF2068 family)